MTDKDLNILHRRKKVRVLKPTANKYSYGRQKVFEFKLSTGYIILRYSKSRVLGAITFLKYGRTRYNKFRKWCRRNHMPRCRAITHAGVCYESWGEVNVSERLKRGPRTHHLDQAFLPNRRHRLIVLKPTPALTLEQSIQLAKFCQRYSAVLTVRDPFKYVTDIINHIFPGRIPDTTALGVTMNAHFKVDHSIHWEKKH